MNIRNFTEEDLKLKLPFGMCIAGPSSSGKSSFILKLIAESDRLIKPPIKSVLYAYGEMNSMVPILQKSGISVYAGVPPEELIKQMAKPLLLILDDLMLTIDEKYLSDLFTKKSHHQNFGVVFATQNLFERKMKVAKQNSQYLALMRAPNMALAIKTLGIQLFPGKSDFWQDSYAKATEKPYGYLFLDMHAASDPALRLRTGIFKSDEEHVIFIPKNGS